MEISTTSVRTYWARLRQKLGGVSRREAISAFKRHVNNREHQELENYRSLSKYAAIGMVQPSHSSWIIVNAGENFSKLLGKNRSEIVGKDFFTVLPTDQRAAFQRKFVEASTDGYSVTDSSFGSDTNGVTMITQCEWPTKDCLRIFHSPKIRAPKQAVVTPNSALTKLLR